MPPKTKFRACYECLIAGERPWDTRPDKLPHASEKVNAAPRTQFFMDLLCLPVEKDVVAELIAPLAPGELLDEYHAPMRDNITALWKEALRVAHEDRDDETRSIHALETLLVLARTLLPKQYTNYTPDVIILLAGRMDDADDVFYALIETIDSALRLTLRAPAHALTLQRLALQLALVLCAFTGSTSLATYMLHRDLLAAAMFALHFSTNVYVIADAMLLVALLSTAGQVHGVAHAAGLGLDPVSSAVVSNAAFQPYQKRLLAYTRGPDMMRIAHALSVQIMYMTEAYVSSEPSLLGWWSTADTLPDLPPPAIVHLVSLWLLVHMSDAFTIGMLEPPTGEPLVVQFLSLSSYLLTHASASERATVYAHTALRVLLALLGPSDGSHDAVRARLLCDEVERDRASAERGVRDRGIQVDRVRLCRDKANPLPSAPQAGDKRPRRLLVPILDNVAIFLKYNRSKRLDAEAFRTALTVVQRCVALCATHEVRLEYDWLELWRAMMATVTFLAARHDELTSHDDAATVAQSVRGHRGRTHTALGDHCANARTLGSCSADTARDACARVRAGARDRRPACDGPADRHSSDERAPLDAHPAGAPGIRSAVGAVARAKCDLAHLVVPHLRRQPRAQHQCCDAHDCEPRSRYDASSGKPTVRCDHPRCTGARHARRHRCPEP